MGIALQTVAGFATASNIGTALVKVVPEAISCSASDVNALNKVKAAVTAAVEEANNVIAVQQNVIKEAVEKINKAIAEIVAVNTILENSGQTKFADPGTTLATVTAPPLPTEITTQQDTTVAGASTVGGATPDTEATTGGENGKGTSSESAATTAGNTPEAGVTTGEGTPTSGNGESTHVGETSSVAESKSSTPILSTANPSARNFFGTRSRGLYL